MRYRQNFVSSKRAKQAALLIGALLLVSSVGLELPAQADAGIERVESASRVFDEAKNRIYQIRTPTQDGAAENSTGSGFLVADGVSPEEFLN